MALAVTVVFSWLAPSPTPVHADAISNLQNQINQDNQKLSSVRQELANLKGQINRSAAAQAELQAIIAQINGQISSVEVQLSTNLGRLHWLQAREKTVTADLVRKQAQLNHNQAIFDSTVRSMAKQQNINYVMLVVTATSFTDLLNRLMEIQQVVSFDYSLVQQLRKERAQVVAERSVLDKERQQQQALVSAIAAKEDLLRQEYSIENAALWRLNQLRLELVAQSGNLQSVSGSLEHQIQSDKLQINSLLNFAQSHIGPGGGDILPPEYLSNAWGTYYNQRDARWGNDLVGSSPYEVWEIGCLLTDVAMVWTHYGYTNVTPGDIAANTNNFDSWGDMYDSGFTVGYGSNVHTPTIYNYDPGTLTIDQYLAQGQPVIVGLNIGSGETHWVTLVGVGPYGYMMNDPWNPDAMDVPLNQYWPGDPIFAAIAY